MTNVKCVDGKVDMVCLLLDPCCSSGYRGPNNTKGVSQNYIMRGSAEQYIIVNNEFNII
jgi:hypothetical protein